MSARHAGHCEHRQSRVLPTCLGSQAAPRNGRFQPQVVKLFGCAPSLSQSAVTPFPTQTNTKRCVPSSHLLG